MSGQLKFKKGAQRSNLAEARIDLNRDKHLRVKIKFLDKSELWFIDQRKFGWIADDCSVLPKGIDALDADLTSEKLEEILQSFKPAGKNDSFGSVKNCRYREYLCQRDFVLDQNLAIQGSGPCHNGQGLALINLLKILLPKRLNTADRRWMTDFINMSAENQEIIGPGAGFTTEKESLVCGVRLRLKRSNRPALNLLVSRMSKK